MRTLLACLAALTALATSVAATPPEAPASAPKWDVNKPPGTKDEARKHFVGTRSLGSGEIWLYDASAKAQGNQGVQLNEKPNWQKDLGEPALSPDGRWLYYSQDATPGTQFEYNKNSRAEIFRIMRQSLDDGRSEPVVTGTGGAVRPQPSPDGKLLAYVRRVSGRSMLCVMDLRSGRERTVWGPVERDLQEAWSVQGVYPGFAWLAGSREVVIWARGQIWRVDMGSGAARAIPFEVNDTRELRAALRPRQPQPVGAQTFPVRQLRWPSVTADGRQLVYSALGHLYVRELPSGTPRRLTTQGEHFEYHPSVSRDGRSVVYVSWSDAELGQVRLLDLATGASRVLTREAGHYSAPRLSPSGRQVVYAKGRGGYLTAPWGGMDGGLYVAAVDGQGEPVRLTPDGSAPQWGADDTAVYFTRDTGKGEVDTERALLRLTLADRRETVLAKSEAATEFALSPDGTQLAFAERFAAYVVPLPATARALALGPKMDALPVRRVGRTAGEYLHWSGDGRTLHHMLGDQWYSTRVDSPAGQAAPASTALAVGFGATTDAPAGLIALEGGRVVTMRGNEVIADATVLVEGARIRAVGPRASVAVPDGAQRIDVRGRTLIPGLIDAHWHGAMAENHMVPQASWVDYASLAFGVTTLHDPSNITGDIFTHAEMQRAGLVTGPRVYSTGAILYGAQGDLHARIDSLDDARAHVQRLRAAGAISVKSYNQPRREQRQMVLQAARESGLLVVPEGGSLFHMNMSMLVDGHTTLEHALPLAHVYDDVKQLWSQTAMAYTPTLGVAYGGLDGEHYWYAHTDVWRHPILSRFVPRSVLEPRAVRRETAPEEDFNVLTVAATVHELAQAGVTVNLGAHGQREGLAAHWELWTLVLGGMTPHEALRAATINPARTLGLDGELGSIEPGKLADLVVIDGDVLSDIRSSDRISHVMQNGRLYALPELGEIAPRQRARAPFYFERDAAAGLAQAQVPAHAQCASHAH